MQNSLKVNLFKHLIAKRADGGFTLIELLVVIIIIGILAAIALPAFLSQASKARQSEAKTYIGSMNRAQQAYYIENGTFAFNSKFSQLGLGIDDQTRTYDYSISTTAAASGAAVRNYAIPRAINGQLASVKAYGGGVSVGGVSAAGIAEAATQAIMCEGVSSPTQGGVQDIAGVDAAITIGAAPANTPDCNETTMKMLK